VRGLGVVATTPQGSRQLWVALPEVSVIGLNAAGDAWLAALCSDAPTVNQVAVPLPATPLERTYCVFKIDVAAATSAGQRFGLQPHVRLGTGDVYGSSPNTIGRLTSSGEAVWMVAHNGVLIGLAPTSDEGLVVHVRADADLSITAVGSSTTIVGPGANVLVRLRPDGSLAWAAPLYRSPDVDFRTLDHGTLVVHPSGEITAAGGLFVQQATFGSGSEATSYDAKGFYSLDGLEVGAGGDGYIARVTADGILRWVRFLTPLSKYGSAITSISVDDEGILFAGHYNRNALLTDGGAGVFLSDVLGEGFPDAPPTGGVIGRFDEAGNLTWWRGHHGSFTSIARSSRDPAIVATLHRCEGSAGFPPTVQEETTSCKDVALSFNANLGFECSRNH